ncbi:MAG: hypothetical protein Q4C65_13280 [Eubacteriales bacterium]|nr:hypothetical protein [Eubacteriales bacterium]
MKDRTKRIFIQYIFPAVLLLWPLCKITQGIELTDTCYGLVNYRFFPHAGQDWTVATYLANVLGALLIRLPFGDTLVGIRFYTGLLVSFMALLSYFFLKGKMPAWIAFAGELLAVSLCWIPTTSLYNYLTFALFLSGTVLLYRGLVWQRRLWLGLAGACLGASVLTRLPNILECGLILAVFYYGFMKKKAAYEIWKDVGVCVLGFLAAFAAGFAAICIQFGPQAYGQMLASLGGYSGTDASYSPLSMLTSVLGAYVRSFKWVLLLLVAAAMGSALFLLWPGRWEVAKKAVYLLMLPVLLRFLWGRGMFNFQYAFYWSVFEWCMVLLYAALGLGVWTLADKRVFFRDRLLVFLVLLVILITPIGSNNETYPNLNNLFLAAPVTFWMGYRLWLRLRTRRWGFPCRAMLVFAACVLLVQGAGFGVRAVFRDSIEGQERDSQVTGSRKLAGAYTNRENAQALQDVVDYYNENGLAARAAAGERLLTFGDVPGFCWLFDMPSALSHDWPDMDTYPAAQMETDLAALTAAGEKPPVILCPGKVEEDEPQELLKWSLLQEFLAAGGYELRMDNGTYRIYE